MLLSKCLFTLLVSQDNREGLCTCVCVCVRQRERKRDQPPTASLPKSPQGSGLPRPNPESMGVAGHLNQL